VAVETYGSIEVTTLTYGANPDPDGYMIQVDGWWDYSHAPTRIGVNGKVLLRSLVTGEHALTLHEIAPNCRGQNLDSRFITVAEERVTPVVYELTCH
jgi:hypothetical protein